LVYMTTLCSIGAQEV